MTQEAGSRLRLFQTALQELCIWGGLVQLLSDALELVGVPTGWVELKCSGK